MLIRSDVLAELEERRDLCLSGLMEALQAQCRLHLARRWLERRRLQEQAVRCIQRNITQFLKLREWPWWRLYVHVQPLLGVARADQAERDWQERLRRLEQHNAELRASRTQADEQLRDVEQLLKAECQTTRSMTASLEREAEQRVRLEAELRALQARLRRGAFGFPRPARKHPN